jgi:hypothetical protein
MQKFINFVDIDLGFPDISSSTSHSKRKDNSIKIIEANCRKCLQYYQQKQVFLIRKMFKNNTLECNSQAPLQAERQKALLLSNRKRAVDQWKKLQDDRLMKEDAFLNFTPPHTAAEIKDQYYYHDLVNEPATKKKVDCIFPGSEVALLDKFYFRLVVMPYAIRFTIL